MFEPLKRCHYSGIVRLAFVLETLLLVTTDHTPPSKSKTSRVCGTEIHFTIVMGALWITTLLCMLLQYLYLIVSSHAFTVRGRHKALQAYQSVPVAISKTRTDDSSQKETRRKSHVETVGLEETASNQPCYIPDTSPRIQDMIQLLTELECEGIGPEDGESCVQIGSHATTGLRGVFAKEDLGVGEFLFAVPFTASLVVMEEEVETTTDADRGLVLLRKYLDPSSASRKELQNKWRPYLDCLPTMDYCFSPTPDFWSHEDIQLLEFPRLVQEALTRKEQVRQLAEAEGVNCDQLQFATWLAKSRCFSVVKVKEGLVKTRSILIPFFDMINHSSDTPNAELQLVETKAADESFYALCTISPIPAGSEVTISYGTTKDSSVELLMNYGILDQSNKSDVNMLKAGGKGCLNRLADWKTTLEDDERALQTAEGNARIALAFRAQMKRAISNLSL